MKRNIYRSKTWKTMRVLGDWCWGTLMLCCLLFAPGVLNAQSNSQWVNVFIGTNGMGHTFPGACYPYGAVQLSPDTDTIPHNINGVYQPRVYDYCAGYQYRDNSIVGFSHTHFLTSSMRHPNQKSLLEGSKSGLIARCFSVRKSVLVK